MSPILNVLKLTGVNFHDKMIIKHRKFGKNPLIKYESLIAPYLKKVLYDLFILLRTEKKLLLRSDSFSFISSGLFSVANSSGSFFFLLFVIHSFT